MGKKGGKKLGQSSLLSFFLLSRRTHSGRNEAKLCVCYMCQLSKVLTLTQQTESYRLLLLSRGAEILFIGTLEGLLKNIQNPMFLNGKISCTEVSFPKAIPFYWCVCASMHCSLQKVRLDKKISLALVQKLRNELFCSRFQKAEEDKGILREHFFLVFWDFLYN